MTYAELTGAGHAVTLVMAMVDAIDVRLTKDSIKSIFWRPPDLHRNFIYSDIKRTRL